MDNTVKNVLKDVFELAFQNELQKLTELDMSKIVYQSLSAEQIDKLALKIDLLPLEYRNILFFRYCFNNTPSETDKILEIENAKYKLCYIQKMLSNLMNLHDSWIDDKSMVEACKLALDENVKEYNNIEILHKPNYSRNFRRKLKEVDIIQNNNLFMLMAKRAAVFILVCLLSFSVVLTVNAEAREKFFDWIIETFPKFSIFTPQSTNQDDNLIDLTSFKINYIPIGFELEDVHEGRDMFIYNYLAENNQELTIKLFTVSNKGKSYYDTENAEIEEFIFKDSKAYLWQIDEMTYLICQQDGIEFHISGNLNKDEIFKVAENISK